MRTYEIRTYGCQMNVHDSERLAGLLEEAGYRAAAAARTRTWSSSTPAPSGRTPTTGCTATSVTCCRSRTRSPGMQIAVGGCLAQKDRAGITAGRRGSTWCSAPTTSAPCRCCWSAPGCRQQAQVEIAESLERFPSVLPARRESAYAAWVAISVGCNNTCTFCIVPSLRGKEEDRRPGDVLAEIRALVGDGRPRGHAARAERQLLRRRVRRPRGVRQAAAGVRRDRRAGAGPLHLAAPGATSPMT